MLSPTFKVRDIDVEDATPYPIHFSWNSTKSEKTGYLCIFHSNILCWFLSVIHFVVILEASNNADLSILLSIWDSNLPLRSCKNYM